MVYFGEENRASVGTVHGLARTSTAVVFLQSSTKFQYISPPTKIYIRQFF